MASTPTSSLAPPSIFSAQLHPNRGLGFLLLGASLHDVLTRLKAEPQRFPELELTYSPDRPVDDAVTVNLPANGIRLRFDGPEQRLRLIEVIDFTRNHVTFKDRDVVRPPGAGAGAGANGPSLNGAASPSPLPGESSSRPTFRHIYHRLLGPTYAGEYIPPLSPPDHTTGVNTGTNPNTNPNPNTNTNTNTNPNTTTTTTKDIGVYVLSYPGVAFTFNLPAAAYSPDKDVVTLLSAPGVDTMATSMAVFSGDSWAAARDTLWTEVLPSINVSPVLAKCKDTCPDEISLVRIHGGGKVQLFKKWTSASLWISLGETTAQQLVAELGPPNAIYNKSDQRMVIHKTRTASHSRSSRPSPSEIGRPDDLTDTDQSSIPDVSDDGSDSEDADHGAEALSGECFFNYFHLGFDVLVSPPAAPSKPPPSVAAADTTRTRTGNGSSSTGGGGGGATPNPALPIRMDSPDRQVATKMVLHGNVPGSYEFNRHRRTRWEIGYLDAVGGADSETKFPEMEQRLTRVWFPDAASKDGSLQRQRGMVLNRGWGDSPSSSCEFLGGWEESIEDSMARASRKRDAGVKDDTTTLYGFPGLVFEVLRNGYVNTVTVF